MVQKCDKPTENNTQHVERKKSLKLRSNQYLQTPAKNSHIKSNSEYTATTNMILTGKGTCSTPITSHIALKSNPDI